MKKQSASRRLIAALAIGVGLIAGTTMFGAVPVRAAEHGETTLAQERFIDESQENGGYGDLRVTAPSFVIDADQENGSSDTEVTVASPEIVIDESQENGGYVSS